MNASKRVPHLFPCADRYKSGGELTRREMLRKSAGGLGAIALAWLSQQTGLARTATVARPLNLLPRLPDFAPRARNIIFLYMGGGPSQVDLLDPKPALVKYDGLPMPGAFEQRNVNGSSRIMASPFKFQRYGQAGTEVSELLPGLATMVDDIAVVRSGKTNRIDHGEALLMMHTGRPISGFPTMGSWITYGLGSENNNLPAYVAMPDGPSERVRNALSSGWLPALFQGTPMNTGAGDPFFYLHRADGNAPSPDRQRAFLDLTQSLNRRHQVDRPEVSELDARIQNFELAARMQLEAMHLMDISKESAETRALYGMDRKETSEFGKRCLLARRLVEAGVRFVHLMRADWDHHADINNKIVHSCRETDLPITGLLRDLKRRGLLDETLVIWTGEFGRLPVVEGSDGRDHNPYGFSFWMAGGGIKGGTVYGATDEFGYSSVEKVVHVADLHATILNLLGLHHDKLIFDYEGREETLIGVEEARVVSELIA